MEDRGTIITKGKGMTESFYVNDKNCDDDIQDEGIATKRQIML